MNTNKMFKLGCLTFQSVNATDLQKDKPYMTLSREVVWHNWCESYWVVGKYQFTDGDRFILGPSRVFIFKKDTQLKTHSFHFVSTNAEFYKIHKNLQIYTLVSSKEKIQQNMENRALQLILKKIVDDPCFSW